MRVTIPDLIAGQSYALQFRARTGTEASEWSQVLRLTTSTDILAPAAVTGLAVSVIGTSFKVTWNPVTTNTDGSSNTDFRDYEIVVTDGVVSSTFFVTENRFDFPIELNTNVFGTPKPVVTFTVRARDINYNTVVTGPNVTGTNPAPAAPSNLVVQPIVNGINFNWTGIADTDLKIYRLYKGATAGTVTTKIYEGLSTNFTYSSTNFGSSEYFRVSAVDVFNQETFGAASSPAAPLGFDSSDVTPPAPPTFPVDWFTSETDLSVPTAIKSNIVLKWTAPADTDLAAYIIQYKKNADSVWTQVRVEGTATVAPATTTKINGLAHNTLYNFQVAAQDKSGNTSSFASPGNNTTTADNTAPTVPSTPTVAPYIGQLIVTWNGLNSSTGGMSSDLAYVEVHGSTVSGFTPTAATQRGRMNPGGGKPQQAIVSGAAYGVTYYVKLVAVDWSGNTSAASGQASAVPVQAADGDIASINAGKITTGELAAGVRVSAGPILGTHAEMSSTGFRVFGLDDTNGSVDEVIRLGTDTNDYFGVTDSSGQLIASINDAGGASFQDMTITNDPKVGGRKLVSEIIDPNPKRFLGYGAQYTSSPSTNTNTGVGVFEVQFYLMPGRMYKFSSSPLRVQANATCLAEVRMLYTLAPWTNASTPATAPTPTVSGANTLTRTQVYVTGGVLTNGGILNKLYAHNYDYPITMRVLLNVGVVDGSGSTVNIYANAGTNVGDVMEIWCEDIGKNTGNLQQVNSGGGGISTPPAPTTPPPQRYIVEYECAWTQTYKGNGTLRTDTTDIIQGYQGSNGDQKAMIGFGDIPGAIGTNAQVEDVQLYLYANHWYYNSGGTALIGAHQNLNAPGSWSGGLYPNQVQSPGFPKPGDRWINVSSMGPLNNWATGAFRGFTLGPSGGTNNEYYGRFYGVNGPYKPRIRIQYVR